MQEDKMRVTSTDDSALHRTAELVYNAPAAGFVPGTGCNLSVGDSP